MNKTIIVLISVILSSSVHAQQISLDEHVGARPKWTEDISEVSYIGSRCGVLFFIVGRYMTQNGNTETIISNGKSFIKWAEEFLSVAVHTGSAIDMSDKFISGRHESLTKWYSYNISENKKNHNDAFVGDVKKDIDFCVVQGALYKALNATLK